MIFVLIIDAHTSLSNIRADVITNVSSGSRFRSESSCTFVHAMTVRSEGSGESVHLRQCDKYQNLVCWLQESLSKILLQFP